LWPSDSRGFEGLHVLKRGPSAPLRISAPGSRSAAPRSRRQSASTYRSGVTRGPRVRKRMWGLSTPSGQRDNQNWIKILSLFTCRIVPFGPTAHIP
jgi:hypothetical protein